MANLNNGIRATMAGVAGFTQSVTAAGTDTYTATLAPAPSAYVTGGTYYITFTNANTSTTPTLNLNALGAKTIVKNGSAALAAGDIPAAHEGVLRYNGTNMVLMNPKATVLATPVSVANGDTGASTLTAHGILVGEGTGAVTPLAAMTNGQIPIGSTGADPVPAAITAGTNIAVTNGAGSITIGVTGSIAGTLSAGSTNTLSSISGATTHAVAHGLGATPAIVMAWLQCTTAELGYSVGDRVSLAQMVYPSNTAGAIDIAIVVEYDATNTTIIIKSTGSAGSDYFLPNKSTSAMTAITNGNWEIVAIPYKIN